jgi:hypothetical protein
MGLFSSNESDAVRQIEKINTGISQIREIIRLTNDEIAPSNAGRVAIILKDCGNYYQKYERIKSNMDFMQSSLFMGLTVNCWNGDRVGVLQWENYFKNVFHMLTEKISNV